MQEKLKYIKLLISFLLIILLLDPLVIKAEHDNITIKVNSLNVRSGPSLDYNIISRVNKDEQYPVIEEKNGWYKIKVNNTEGWVASWYVEIEKEASYSKYIEANSANINIRSGPSTSFSILGQIQPGDKYPFLGEEGEWVKILLSNNKFGWVAKWLVTISESTNPVTSKTDNATVNADVLNVRSGPSKENAIIGKLYLKDQIKVIAVDQGWYKIIYQNSFGWIASEYAVISNSSEDNNSQSDELNSPTEEFTTQKFIVQPDILNLRAGPGLDYEIIEKLKKGDSLITDKIQGEWLHIYLESNPKINGWVASWLVIDSNKVISNEPTVTILNPGTNLREGPSTSYKVIAIANTGDKFPIIATEGDWYQVLLPDGKKAFVAGWIVSVTGIEKKIEHGMNEILKNRVIVIDPGHGGNDYGATGVNFNSIEKELNLSIAIILKNKLKATGAKVIMTRSNDTKIGLQQRVDTAIYNNADIFVSIHHNTNTDYSLNGTITYYYKNIDKKLAQAVHNELMKYTLLNDLNARYGNYYVLRENTKPSILIELAFITNYHDELRVRSSKFQENAAEGIFQGIVKYFNM